MPKSSKGIKSGFFSSTDLIKEILREIEYKNLVSAKSLIEETPLPTLNNVLKKITQSKASKANVFKLEELIKSQFEKLSSENRLQIREDIINREVKSVKKISKNTTRTLEEKRREARKKETSVPNEFKINERELWNTIRIVKLFLKEDIGDNAIKDILVDENFEKVPVSAPMNLVVSFFFYLSLNRICCGTNKICKVLARRFKFESRRTENAKSVERICDNDDGENKFRLSQEKCIEGIHKLMGKNKNYKRNADKKEIRSTLVALKFDEKIIDKVFGYLLK